MGGGLLARSLKRKNALLSTPEAKYVAMGSGVKEGIFFSQHV